MEQRTNKNIRVSVVRLVNEETKQSETMPTSQALAKAESLGLDLVEVNPKTSPPICKIMDFSKFLYEEKKRLKQVNRAQKENKISLKETVVHPNTGENDLVTKARQILSWLEEGNMQVRITVLFKKRELQHPEVGQETLKNLLGMLENSKFVVLEPQGLQGTRLSVLIGSMGRK